LHAKIAEVSERHAPTVAVDLAPGRRSADDLCNFDIEQVRRVQRLSGREQVG
jgi:hypothetical protein